LNGGERRLRLELPATHRAVRVARHMVRHFARLEGVAGEELETLTLVASELLGNAVDHGGGGAAMEEDDHAVPVAMDMELGLTGTGWTLAVTDRGGGDPEELRSLFSGDGVPDLEDERGRGFFLLRQLVDRIDVERSADGAGLTLVAVREHGEG